MDVIYRKGTKHLNADYMSREAALRSPVVKLARIVPKSSPKKSEEWNHVVAELWEQTCWEDIEREYRTRPSKRKDRKAVFVGADFGHAPRHDWESQRGILPFSE